MRTGAPGSAMATKKCATARLHARITRASVVGWKRRESSSAACRRAVPSRGTAGSGNVHPGSLRAARGTDCVPVGSVLLTPPPAAGHAEDENRRRGNARARTSMGDGSKGWFSPCITRCDLGVRWLATALAAPRRFPAQPSVFAGNRYWRGRKRWQATALQDRLSLGGNAVVCLRSGPYDGRKENSSRTVPESGRSSSAGAQYTAYPHAARYDVHRIGEGNS